jgi:hypothetical protein
MVWTPDKTVAQALEFPARKLWLSPFANLIVSGSGNLASGNTIVADASYSMLRIGAGLTWR